MRKRSAFLFAFFLVVLLGGSANAQGNYEFLGAPRSVPDKFSPRYGIRYNTQGFDDPGLNWTKRAAKLAKKGVPESAISEMMAFPGDNGFFIVNTTDGFDAVRLLSPEM